MKKLDIYEHEIIKDDLIYFVALLLTTRSFNKKPIEIKQLSYKDEKYPFAILWAMEWLYSHDALTNYTIHVPISGLPDDLNGNQRPPMSYRRSSGFENYAMVPEYIGSLLNRYPDSIDKSYCSFYVDVNHQNLEALLKKNAEYFKACGNIYTSECSYQKQLITLINFIRDKYQNNGQFNQIGIELNNPILKEIDIVRIINALHLENVKQNKKKDLHSKEKLITLFDSHNKRNKWVNGLDETTIYFRLSDYFISKYLKKTNKYPISINPINKKSFNSKAADNIIVFEEAILNFDESTLKYESNSILVNLKSNPVKLLKLLMSEPDKLHEYKDILYSFDPSQTKVLNNFAGPLINQGSEAPLPIVKTFFRRIKAEHIMEQIKTEPGKGLILYSSQKPAFSNLHTKETTSMSSI